MKTVLFFDPNLNERGTSIAAYDYAHYNETILGNKSIIASYKNAGKLSYSRFADRFEEVHLVDSFSEIDTLCDKKGVYGVHILKYGHRDNQLTNSAKNLVHVVFPAYDPHGDVYTYISKWLANQSGGTQSTFVPHMVNLPDIDSNYREVLHLKNKLIVGWYGGDNFEIPHARQAVINAAKERSDIVFMFMNQQPFCELPNVLFFNATTDLEEKVAFINTCDVMIHARERGETFGLAIAEFSTKNKPVITCHNAPERNHIETLGERGIYYKDYESLYNILTNIKHSDLEGDWNCYKEFTPEAVMDKFNKIFLL